MIDVWGDFAVARYYLDYEFEAPGAVQGRVRITTVARRVDGEWLRVHHHEGVAAHRPAGHGRKLRPNPLPLSAASIRE